MRPLAVALLLTTSPYAGNDGEIGWTSLSFCNASQYCVKLNSDVERGLTSVAIEFRGAAVSLPDHAVQDVQIPVLNKVRMVNIGRIDGVAEDRLEIPFLRRTPGGGHSKFILKIWLVDGSVRGTAVESAQK